VLLLLVALSSSSLVLLLRRDASNIINIGVVKIISGKK